MRWTEPIDGYCERIGTAFWAEPVNAASNLAFILAAFVGLVVWRRMDKACTVGRGRRDATGLALVVLVAVIGTGSFLFHTFANAWSSLADVLPIAIFIYGYFALALHRFVGLGRLTAGLATIAFFGASFLADDVFGALVGSSASYVPALLALLGIGGWLLAHDGPQGRRVLGAGLVFAVSLTFRTIDGRICEAFPLGTHFVWHILNAVTLGLLLVAAVRHGPRPAKRRITA